MDPPRLVCQGRALSKIRWVHRTRWEPLRHLAPMDGARALVFCTEPSVPRYFPAGSQGRLRSNSKKGRFHNLRRRGQQGSGDGPPTCRVLTTHLSLACLAGASSPGRAPMGPSLCLTGRLASRTEIAEAAQRLSCVLLRGKSQRSRPSASRG